MEGLYFVHGALAPLVVAQHLFLALALRVAVVPHDLRVVAELVSLLRVLLVLRWGLLLDGLLLIALYAGVLDQSARGGQSLVLVALLGPVSAAQLVLHLRLSAVVFLKHDWLAAKISLASALVGVLRRSEGEALDVALA